MVGVSKEVVDLIYHLLPGFLAAWVFYALTTHPKRSPFERTVQALIFTALVRAIVISTRTVFLSIGPFLGWTIGTWTADLEFVYAMSLAFILGHVLSYFANNNLYHGLLAKYKVTLRTSYASEWYSTFSQIRCYIILHIDGNRRLYGWPYEWPDNPETGHFVIQDPAWLLDDNTKVELVVDEVMLIPVTSVELVEFLKSERQLKGQSGDIAKAEKILVDLRKKKTDNGDELGTLNAGGDGNDE